MSHVHKTLVIFVKEPLPGRVKTRLAAGMGQMGSVRAAHWFRRESLSLIRRLAADPRWQTVLAVSPDVDGQKSGFWPPDVRRIPQRKGNLGDRMGRVFREWPRPGPVIIIGADIPEIQRHHIASGFAALGRAEAVCGPTYDGGYWLIGLRRSPQRRPAGLFRDVRWSTSSALTDTLASLPLSWRVELLTPLHDVDTIQDLIALRGRHNKQRQFTRP